MDELVYEPPPEMKSDCLWLIRTMCCDLPETKQVTILLIGLFIGLASTTLFTTYHFLVTMDVQDFKIFGPIYLIGFMPLCLLIKHYVSGRLDILLHQIRLWEIDSAGEETKKDIERRIRYMNLTGVFGGILALAAGVAFALRQESDEKFMLALYYFNKYLPYIAPYLGRIYQASCVFLCFVCIMTAMQGLYVFEHSIYQLQMFKKYVQGIDCSPKDEDEDKLRNDENYHKEVKKRLAFVVERDCEFLRLISSFNKITGVFFVVFTTCAILFVIGLILYVLTVDHLSVLDCFRFGLTGLAVVFFFFRVVYAGQSVEDYSFIIRTLFIELKWEIFNKENKQIYITRFEGLLHEHRVAFSEEYSLNYQFGLAVFRAIYSIISVAVNLYR